MTEINELDVLVLNRDELLRRLDTNELQDLPAGVLARVVARTDVLDYMQIRRWVFSDAEKDALRSAFLPHGYIRWGTNERGIGYVGVRKRWYISDIAYHRGTP